MLRALKDHLVVLSQDPKDRFLMHVRRRVGASESRRMSDPLRNFVLVLPGMLAQICAWFDAGDVSPRLKKLQGYLLTYLYHPSDYLHDRGYGLFGYLDDAYLTGTVYRAVREELQGSRFRMLPNQSDIPGQLDSWLETAEKVIPRESARMKKMVQDLLMDRQDSFQSLFSRPDRYPGKKNGPGAGVRREKVS